MSGKSIDLYKESELLAAAGVIGLVIVLIMDQLTTTDATMLIEQ